MATESRPGFSDLNLEGQQQVQRWLGHAQNYVQQVLAPRCRTLQSEVCVGVNWVTGEAEVFPDVKGRGYPDRPGWMFGTADLVAILNTGELYVGDWKTGGSDGAKEQLLSLGVAFQRCMPISFNYQPIARPLVTACLSVQDHGVVPMETTYQLSEVANHWDAMRFAWEDIGKQDSGVPGIHCTQLYCPHLAHCSSISGIVTEAAEADGGAPGNGRLLAPERLRKRFQMTDSPGSSEEAGHVMAYVSAARRQCKYWDTAMKEYVRNGGRVTYGQYVWQESANGFRWKRQ